jgi:hypothetical protein
LPIVVSSDGKEMGCLDSIIAALKHKDRLCELHLSDLQSWILGKILKEMQQPYPALTILALQLTDEIMPAISASLLGGSPPLLHELWLNRIPFPGLRPRRSSVVFPY